MQDNITEHPTTIKIFERMNIYQEVVLAAVYKSFPFIQVGIFNLFKCLQKLLKNSGQGHKIQGTAILAESAKTCSMYFQGSIEWLT